MRSSGVLLHISSLPSTHGIGTLGRDAYGFVDFLSESNQRYWQILPVNPTGYGDSPYQSVSVFAGNPYFIDLDFLCDDGLLSYDEIDSVDFGSDEQYIDFEKIYYSRLTLLKAAYSRFDTNDEDFQKFVERNMFWLDNYALFMAIKDQFNHASWLEWDESFLKRDASALECFSNEHQYEINYYKFIQYSFFDQWKKLKEYANSKRVKIIGDIPIYVAQDSADVWANTSMFQLDYNTMYPTHVAGCPPDYFCEDGQLWGNPLYNWKAMKQDGYSWWIQRMKLSAEIFDVVRIDHFRGFDSYYAIPYGNSTARFGTWEEGPKEQLFKAIESSLGHVEIIAENLGHLSASVFELLEKCGYPGMSVLQFAFSPEEDSIYLPHNCVRNSVIYPGTHDNDTVLGWADTTAESQVHYAMEYLGVSDKWQLPWAFIKAAWASPADTAIVQMQDILELGSCARMNTPSTLGLNWKWRMLPKILSGDLRERLRDMTRIYQRNR